MADTVNITFTRERIITETFTTSTTVERLQALVAEHAPDHSEDILNGLDVWNVDDLAPVLAAIVAEASTEPTESKTSDSISNVTHDADEYLCGDHLVSEHCDCGECPEDHACEGCEQCPDECDCDDEEDEEDEDEEDDE